MTKSPSLNLKVEALYKSLPCKDENLDIIVSLDAVEIEDAKANDRAPIDVVLVLDKSGSMSGEKIELCKATAEFLCKELKSKDKLGIVTYDTDVNTIFDLRLMDRDGKEAAKNSISMIQSGSMTNLSGGLIRGLTNVKDNMAVSGNNSSERKRAVFLLTDGHANHGITDAATLTSVVSSMLETMPGTSVYTFGYGGNHNAELLRQLSETGNGMYYFILQNDDVATAFGDCLGSLLTCVANEVVMSLRAGPGVQFDKISTPFKKTENSKNGSVQVMIPDMSEEENRTVLLKIKAPKLSTEVLEGDGPLLFVEVRYADVYTKKFEMLQHTFCVARPMERSSDDTPNLTVLEHINRYRAAEALKEAMKKADKGNFDLAQKRCQGVLRTIKESYGNYEEEASFATKTVVGDLRSNMETMQSQQWMARGKSLNMAMQQQHLRQKSSGFGASADVYRGKKKMAYKSRAKTEVNRSMMHRSRTSIPRAPPTPPQPRAQTRCQTFVPTQRQSYNRSHNHGWNTLMSMQHQSSPVFPQHQQQQQLQQPQSMNTNVSLGRAGDTQSSQLPDQTDSNMSDLV